MQQSALDPGGRWRVRASAEQRVLVAAVYWLLAGNQGFLAAALRGRSLLSVAGAGLAVSLDLVADCRPGTGVPS